MTEQGLRERGTVLEEVLLERAVDHELGDERHLCAEFAHAEEAQYVGMALLCDGLEGTSLFPEVFSLGGGISDSYQRQ